MNDNFVRFHNRLMQWPEGTPFSRFAWNNSTIGMTNIIIVGMVNGISAQLIQRGFIRLTHRQHSRKDFVSSQCDSWPLCRLWTDHYQSFSAIFLVATHRNSPPQTIRISKMNFITKIILDRSSWFRSIAETGYSNRSFPMWLFGFFLPSFEPKESLIERHTQKKQAIKFRCFFFESNSRRFSIGNVKHVVLVVAAKKYFKCID